MRNFTQPETRRESVPVTLALASFYRLVPENDFTVFADCRGNDGCAADRGDNGLDRFSGFVGRLVDSVVLRPGYGQRSASLGGNCSANAKLAGFTNERYIVLGKIGNLRGLRLDSRD